VVSIKRYKLYDNYICILLLLFGLIFFTDAMKINTITKQEERIEEMWNYSEIKATTSSPVVADQATTIIFTNVP
jgi:hypothetical protein